MHPRKGPRPISKAISSAAKKINRKDTPKEGNGEIESLSNPSQVHKNKTSEEGNAFMASLRERCIRDAVTERLNQASPQQIEKLLNILKKYPQDESK